MVVSGLFVGLATGGYPAFSREVSQIALALAMTFSLTEIAFSGITPRAEVRGVILSFGMSYIALTGMLLGFAAMSSDPSIRQGWVLMAAVPPAVAVIPITSLLGGDTRGALIASAIMYLLGLALVPGITLAFLGRAVPVEGLAAQTVLLIGVPLAVSRPLLRVRQIGEIRPTAVAVSFFFLVVAIAGSTRSTLLGNPELLVSLSVLSFARTFGLGFAVVGAATLLGLSRADRITATAFASFKNLGLAVVLAFSFFPPVSALPSIVSLVFEIAWLGALPYLFREVTRPR